MKLTKQETSMVKIAAAVTAVVRPMVKKATLQQKLANYGITLKPGK
jgi:hypothetical protein